LTLIILPSVIINRHYSAEFYIGRPKKILAIETATYLTYVKN